MVGSRVDPPAPAPAIAPVAAEPVPEAPDEPVDVPAGGHSGPWGLGTAVVLTLAHILRRRLAAGRDGGQERDI